MELIMILIVTLGILYFIIKGAVEDGILEAHAELDRRTANKDRAE